MQNFIQLPTENIYDLKSKEFYQSKLADRLKKKFEPKPFEENYKPVYWISFTTSYFCSLFSILTASTFVFVYIYSLMEKLPYPFVWATVAASAHQRAHVSSFADSVRATHRATQFCGTRAGSRPLDDREPEDQARVRVACSCATGSTCRSTTATAPTS